MIAVVGSINLDLVLRVQRFPSPGETLAGTDVAIYSGGKGANQAVAAARLGGEVCLFGKVGDDAFGEQLLAKLRGRNLCVAAVEREAQCNSGLASIWVNADGENAIVLGAGANDRVDRAYVAKHLTSISQADLLLLQLEIPMDTIAEILQRLPDEGPYVILDPAPARDLSELQLERIQVLTPNEHELRRISGEDSVEEGAFRLLDRGVRNVVCTLGAQGAIWYSSDGAVAHFSAPDVYAVDTTAAGDAFNGALAWALQTVPLEEAIAQAVVAGAWATTKHGAQQSLPSREDLRTLLLSSEGA